MNYASYYATNFSDNINPKAVQMFFNKWKNRAHYASMRVDYCTWYVMCMHYNFIGKNTMIPIFKRTHVIKLAGGCYLCCSCNLCKHTGIACTHIAFIIDEISPYFLHVMHLKSCAFYYLREGTSDKMSKHFENVSFLNEAPGVYWDKVLLSDSYPMLSTNTVTLESFADVIELDWPIILNWPTKTTDQAVSMINAENITPLGMEMELSDNVTLADAEYEDSYEIDHSALTLTCNHRQVPLYHSMHAHVKERAKYEAHMSDEMVDYVNITLTNLLGSVVSSVADAENNNLKT